MSRPSILERLSDEVPDLRRRFGVDELAVFGSVARGEDHAGSDLDVLVSFDGKSTFDRFMGLKLHLEALFQRRVDLITFNSLARHPRVKAEIEKDLVHVS